MSDKAVWISGLTLVGLLVLLFTPLGGLVFTGFVLYLLSTGTD